MLACDENVQLHLAAVERLLRVVCDDDEYPWFVSDEASLQRRTQPSAAGETAVRIVVYPGTSQIITAYPVMP